MTENNQVTTQQVRPITIFRQALTQMAGDLKNALPEQIPVERFIRTTLTACQMDPSLLDADRTSLLASTMKAAQDGLMCDGREAALVIFNAKTRDGGWTKKVQYMPMISGLLKKIRNSGLVSSIDAKAVYKNDDFKYWVDEQGEHFTYSPQLDTERGEFRLAFAYAVMKDGTRTVCVMTREDIESVRAASKTKDTGPWKAWYGPMAEKSALRRLAKRMPSSSDLQGIFKADNDTYDIKGDDAKVIEGETQATQSLAQKMAIGADTVFPTEEEAEDLGGVKDEVELQPADE